MYHNGFLKNYRKWKDPNNDPTPDELYYCLTSLNHFGMYWQKNPYFTIKEIENFFSDRKIAEKNIYEFLFQHDLKLSGKEIDKIKYIGEKTPINVFHLGDILNWFPEATVLFIFRDPIMVLKSEANKNVKPDYPMTKSNPLYHIGIVIFVFIEWLLAGLIALNHVKNMKNKFRIISYETLIDSKHEMVEVLSKSLGINFDEKLYDVGKIDSSYSAKKKKIYWEPSFMVKILFNLLTPLYNRLKNLSVL